MTCHNPIGEQSPTPAREGMDVSPHKLAVAAVAATVLFAASAHAAAPKPGTEDYDLLMPFEHWVTEQQSRIYHHDDWEGGFSSCCGTADGRTVEARRADNASGWQVLITKAPDKFPWATPGWRDVPPIAVKNVPNPVGLPVVWVTSADVIECFRPAAED